MRKAPSVASSWLSWISTLMTWTGCRVSCSLELRSGDQQQTRQRTTQLEAVKHSPQSYHFGIEMWNSSIKAAFIQESSEQPSLSFPSAQRYILMRDLTLQHLVIDPLLTGDDQVELVLAVLKALWFWFDALVAVQHVQDAVLCVSEEWGGQGSKQQ